MTRKSGEGVAHWKKKLFLKQFMEEMGGIDLGYKGCKYTWDNGQEGHAKIREMIDKAIASPRWIFFFPNEVVEHLRVEESDHAPILVHTAYKPRK